MKDIVKIIAAFLVSSTFIHVVNQYMNRNIRGLTELFKYIIMTQQLLIPVILLMTIGFIWAIDYFKSPWIAGLIYAPIGITTKILIIYLVFNSIPKKGEVIGLVLSYIGALISVAWK